MQNSLKLHLDWPAYWQSFKAAHGDPVLYRGQCLFADGWRYSADDPAGSEWPPPEDEEELRQLQQAYWTIRHKQVKAEWTALLLFVQGVKELQAARSLPVQHRWIEGDEAGNRTVVRGPVDVEAIEQGRLAWLKEDLEICKQRLKELGEMNEKHSAGIGN